jgi:hypothetical protein
MAHSSERFHFSNLADLRDWLNNFETTDLSVVLPKDADFISLDWIESTLSDGSTVNDVSINTDWEFTGGRA